MMNFIKETTPICLCLSATLITFVKIIFLVKGSSSELIQKGYKAECICPGDTLTFECSVIGDLATIWKGTIFNCFSNDIFLRHIRFTDGISGECNHGAILAQSIGITGNNYTSQLNVTVISEMNNQTVECYRYSDRSTPLGKRTVAIAAVPSISDVMISNVENGQITFTWSHLTHNCPSLQYNTMNSHCGDCPSTTTSSSVTCNNINRTRFAYICVFAVQPVVCESIRLMASRPVAILIDGPRPIAFTHLVLFQNMSVFVAFDEVNPVLNHNPFNITIISYTITFSDSITDINCGSANLDPNSTCVNGRCSYVHNLQSLCPNSNSIKVNIFATNVFGDGEESEEVVVSVSRMENNDFVNETSTIIYAVVGWVAFVVALFALVVLTTIKCVKKVSAIKSNHQRERISHRQRNIGATDGDRYMNDADIVVYSLVQPCEDMNMGIQNPKEHVTVVCDHNNGSHQLTQTLVHEVTERDQPKLACAETAIYQNKFNEIDNTLNLDTLLIQIRSQVTPKWYQFGVAVGISKETLDELSNFPPEECVVEMLDLWLRTRETAATWRDVADILKQIGLYLLAEKILKIYKFGKIKNEQGTEVTIQQCSLALSHNVISLENCSSDDDCTVCPSLPPKSNHDQ